MSSILKMRFGSPEMDTMSRLRYESMLEWLHVQILAGQERNSEIISSDTTALGWALAS